MFDHLVTYEPEVEDAPVLRKAFSPLKDVPPTKLLHAQQATAQWLDELGVPDDEEITEEQQRLAAREAFAAMTTAVPEQDQTASLIRLKTPAAIQKLNSMLTAYDWEWIERSAELRSYAVGKILEETNHIDARVRLRALELLGKVTEVGLFTERVEITKRNLDEEELETRVREKLEGFLKLAGVVDVEPKEKEGDSDETVADTTRGD